MKELLHQIATNGQAIATIVGATVGFLGVMATLLWNGLMSRRADYRKTMMEKKSEEQDRQHERNVLRVALQAELRSLSRSVCKEIEFIKGIEEFSWVPIIDFFRVYSTNLDKLGLLTPKEVEHICQAYYIYQEHTGYIARLGEVDITRPLMGTNIYLNFKGQHGGRNRQWSLNSLREIKEATDRAVLEIKQELDF